MIRALVVLALVACGSEAKHDEPSKPAPPPSERVAALTWLREAMQTTHRKHSPVEAQPQLTAAYVDLVIGYGYVRAGAADQANALVDRAAKALPTGDPVHAYLVAAFRARIAGGTWPDPLRQQRLAVDRVARYKIDRLAEGSPILEPITPIDAIGVFSNRWMDPRGPELDRLGTLTGPARWWSRRCRRDHRSLARKASLLRLSGYVEPCSGSS